MKELVNDINENVKPKKQVLSARTKCGFGVTILGAVAVGVFVGYQLLPHSIVELRETPQPALTSEINSQDQSKVKSDPEPNPVSNTITENVIYVEYLEPTSTYIQSNSDIQSDTESTKEVGSFKVSFSDELVPTSYPDVYTMNDTFVYIGNISESGSLVDAYVESEQKNIMVPSELTVIPREFLDAASNFSTQDIDAYVWQKQVTLGPIVGYQTMVVFNSYCVGFIDPYQFQTDLAQDIVAQISKTAPVKVYKLLDQTVDTFYNFNSFQFIAPSGLQIQDMGTFSQLDMGESLSNNKLFMVTVPLDKIDTSLLSKIEIILSCSGYSADSGLKLVTDTNATWLNRTARYVEYSRENARVCAYVFPNHITNEATVFFVAEKDNKFPFMLKYLNTLASEIGDF